MSVIVSFVEPKGIGGVNAAPSIGECRARETLSLDGTTTNTAQLGEIVIICSTESSTILATHGKTPDASTATKTSASSAGYPVAPNNPVVVVPDTGDKINVKALS